MARNVVPLSPLLLQLGLGVKRRPRNFPEELDQKYVVCCVKAACERVYVEGTLFGLISNFIFFLSGPIKKYILLLLFFCPSAAQCRGDGERRRSSRQTAAAEGNCRHLLLQEALQLQQSRGRLLRPVLNRY